FIDSYAKVEVHFVNETQIYEVKKGTTLHSMNLKTNQTGYAISGYYLDSFYEKPYDPMLVITSDLVVYGKLTYSIPEVNTELSVSTLVSDLEYYIESLILGTTSYHPIWNQEGFKGRWNYIDGVFLNSVVNLYYETHNSRYKEFFINYINYYIDEEGNFINPETKLPTGYQAGELDSVCESRILFDAYEMTKDERYLIAIAKTYDSLMQITKASGSENFSHKERYLNQIWLDGMYMYVPFFARYAQAKNDSEIFSLIRRQYEYIKNHMFDVNKMLYYHGHDTTKSMFWADSTTGNSKNFWLRSNGWFIVSLVDVLEYYPEGEDKEYLTSLLAEALKGIMIYKDETTNMFFQLIDKGPTAYLVHKDYLQNLKNYRYGNGDAIVNNYLESSGSSMIAYAAIKAARLGYVASSYEQIGIDIFEGVYSHSYQNGNLNDICITAGLGPESSPYRDGSIEYYLAEPVGSNDAKGVGPFLMAYIEYAKVKNQMTKYFTVTQVLPNGQRELSYPFELGVNDLPYPYIPNYIFDGFYFDQDFKEKIPYERILNQDITIYAKYVKEPSVYDDLKNSSSIIIDEDFDSYTDTDSLPEFNTWGTKGIYYYISDADDPGIDITHNHIQLGQGDAYLFDDSEYDGTQLIMDAGSIAQGIIHGYMEVSLEYAGNSWTFFQMYGKRTGGSNIAEIFGARFEEGILKYRINGGEVRYPYGAYIYPSEESFSIEYLYNLDTKTLTVKINGKLLVSELDMSTAESFSGIKIVSSNKMAYYYDEYNEVHYVHRRARIDNII
ncbi:MAG: glycoside hydrolase family 88 protein, partial [Anaeroplasmataceae bacterium]|nr:glycoside hydrolase family 88 protein [Anaeroplasmataceae bacterium]